jgi:thioredoxin 1
MSKFQELINGPVPVLVDFYAEWCGPCKMMAPVLQQLAGKMGDKVKILKVDVDKNGPAAQAYRVQGVPTFILFKNGQVVWRQSGAMSIDVLERAIAENS